MVKFRKLPYHLGMLIKDIPTSTLDELRPYVQRGLELAEWPGDWNAAGLIITTTRIQINRLAAEPYLYSVAVMGMGIGQGIGSGNDVDPLIAIFRAFVTWKAYQVNIMAGRNTDI